MDTINCRNCQHLYTGNFCPQCGQRANEHRINASYFLHDIPHSVFHIDKGFPYTLGQLLKRPAKTLEAYLAGKRVRFFRPFAYVILMSAIGALLTNQITRLIHYVYLNKTGKVIEQQESFFKYYPSAFIFCMIPLASLCTWLMFRKNRYNFWEHLLMNTYLAAQLNILLVLMQLFSLIWVYFTGNIQYFLTVFMTGFMTYYAVTFSGLMHKEMIGWKLGMRLGLMCFILASTYATGMIVTGVLRP